MCNIEKVLSVLFGKIAAKRTKNGENGFASAEATRALPSTCEPLKRLDPNFMSGT